MIDARVQTIALSMLSKTVRRCGRWPDSLRFCLAIGVLYIGALVRLGLFLRFLFQLAFDLFGSAKPIATITLAAHFGGGLVSDQRLAQSACLAMSDRERRPRVTTLGSRHGLQACEKSIHVEKVSSDKGSELFGIGRQQLGQFRMVEPGMDALS